MTKFSALFDRLRLELILLFLLSALVVWGLPITGSLWLDELISFWIIKDSPQNVFYRAFEFQGQSPLYFLILWWTAQFNSEEWFLRLPSLIVGAFSIAIFFQVARNWLSREAAILATLLLLGMDRVHVALFSARPYSFALFSALAATFFLVRWIERRSVGSLVLYAVCMVMTYFFHYLFILIYCVHLLYVVLRRTTGADLRIVDFIIASCFIGIGLIPGLFQLVQLFGNKDVIDLSLALTSDSVTDAWFRTSTLIPAGVAILVGWLVAGGKVKSPQLQVVLFLTFWACMPPLLFYLLSRTIALSIFVDRYYLWYVPGFALLLGLSLDLLERKAARQLGLLIAWLLLVVVELGHFWHQEDWREAIRISRENVTPDTLVLAYPGLIESQDPRWLSDAGKSDYLLAPFSYYPLESRKILLPLNAEASNLKKYFQEFVLPQVKLHQKLVLLSLNLRTRDPLVPDRIIFAPEYYRRLLKNEGFASRSLGNFGLVSVYLLERIVE
ncbi:MAG: glycosyltransferase family 39 protein [Bdellovibrionales bacterium]|nr:glycosyltransferase family 39 protein [Bdellovibrionales bacterium]